MKYYRNNITWNNMGIIRHEYYYWNNIWNNMGVYIWL